MTHFTRLIDWFGKTPKITTVPPRAQTPAERPPGADVPLPPAPGRTAIAGK